MCPTGVSEDRTGSHKQPSTKQEQKKDKSV